MQEQSSYEPSGVNRAAPLTPLEPVIGFVRRTQPDSILREAAPVGLSPFRGCFVFGAERVPDVALRTTQQERRMTSQDPNRPPRTSIDPGLFGWATAALVVAVTIVAIIALFNALNRGPIERRTGTGPSTTQSAPNSTGQGGAANT